MHSTQAPAPPRAGLMRNAESCNLVAAGHSLHRRCIEGAMHFTQAHEPPCADLMRNAYACNLVAASRSLRRRCIEGVPVAQCLCI